MHFLRLFKATDAQMNRLRSSFDTDHSISGLPVEGMSIHVEKQSIQWRVGNARLCHPKKLQLHITR